MVDGTTDGWTERRMDRHSYRVACTPLIRGKLRDIGAATDLGWVQIAIGSKGPSEKILTRGIFKKDDFYIFRIDITAPET